MDREKLTKQIKKFEEYMMVDKGLSEVTVEGYCRCISIALRRMRKFAPDYENIKEYILWMYKEKYSYSHVVNSSLAIEHYTTFKGAPVKLGRPKKPRRLLKDTLSEAEVSRVLCSAKNVREKALVGLLAFSGLRNSEVCNLRVSDVDLGNNSLRVQSGKNFKDRYVNISGDCTKLLIEYLKTFPRENETHPLFTTLVKNNVLNPRDIRKHLRNLAQRAQIQRRVYPHLLRHSLAINLLGRGASLMTIKDQLGHVYYETTLIYLRSMPQRTKSEYEFFAPAYM